MNPSNIDRCKELLDVLWYFLKSTDNIITIEKNSIGFNQINELGYETKYGFSIGLKYDDNIDTEIRGWFPQEYITNSDRDGYIKIILGKNSARNLGFHVIVDMPLNE